MRLRQTLASLCGVEVGARDTSSRGDVRRRHRGGSLMRSGCSPVGGAENAGPGNAGLENVELESDELRLKQPQTRSTIDVSELSQNCVGL